MPEQRHFPSTVSCLGYLAADQEHPSCLLWGLGPEPEDELVPGEPTNAAASSEAGLLPDSLPGSLC